ncbi:MAG: hypothetical protein V4584_13430 [Verrucomicrobiota bacterium]
MRILRLGLILSSCGWGISFFFTFAPWQTAANQLYDMGANQIPYDPLLDYWLRMASSAFGSIGIASAIACARPAKFTGLITLLGPFHFVVGITLAVSACRNHLDPELHSTFIPDITFCFLTGCLIVIPQLRERLMKGK